MFKFNLNLLLIFFCLKTFMRLIDGKVKIIRVDKIVWFDFSMCFGASFQSSELSNQNILSTNFKICRLFVQKVVNFLYKLPLKINLITKKNLSYSLILLFNFYLFTFFKLILKQKHKKNFQEPLEQEEKAKWKFILIFFFEKPKTI